MADPLTMLANLVVGAVALLHIYFLVLEMFLWDQPVGLRTFGQTREQAATTKVLAANQGLYNGFLAAGLIWGLIADNRPIKIFFLVCVLIAGIYGAISVNRFILWVQGLPAALGLVLVIAGR